MSLYKFYTLFFLCLLSFYSCEVINPEEEIPSYIEILPFNYVGSDGSNSQKITDAWISVGGRFIGAFDLPKTIPVLANGEQEIVIDAGINENGFTSLPNIYPFYERYMTSIELTPGEVVTVQPSTRYDDALVQIIFNESFDDGLFAFSGDLEGTTTDVKEGDGSALISLDAEDNPAITISSTPLDKFPGSTNIAYIEMDYKSEGEILIGVTGYDIFGDVTYSTEEPYGLLPKGVWNKAYFNFSEDFNLLQQTNTDRYQIIILSRIPIENGAFTLENAEIRLDNIKIVAF